MRSEQRGEGKARDKGERRGGTQAMRLDPHCVPDFHTTAAVFPSHRLRHQNFKRTNHKDGNKRKEDTEQEDANVSEDRHDGALTQE